MADENINWDAVIHDDIEQQNIQARAALGYAGTHVKGEDAAQARMISRLTGIPESVTLLNPDYVKTVLSERGYNEFVTRNQDYSAWIAQNANIIHDDTGPLDKLFNGIRTFYGAGVVSGVVGTTLAGTGAGLTAQFQPKREGLERYAARADTLSPWEQAFSGVDSELLLTMGSPTAEERTNVGGPLIEAGEAVKRLGDVIGPKVKEGLAYDVISGTGQAFGMVLSAVATRSPVLPALMAYAQGADQMAQDARRHGSYGTPAGDAAIIGGGLITSGTNAVALHAILNPAFKKITSTAGRIFSRFAVGSMAESWQEGTEQLSHNYLARELYDPNRNIWEGVGYNALIGAIVGGILGGGMGAIQERRRPPTPEEANAAAIIFDNDTKALEATQARDRLAVLMNDADVSKAAARDPAAVAALIREKVGEENKTVTISGEVLVRLYESANGPDLVNQLGLSRAEIIAAYEQGGELAVDFGDLIVSEQARAIKDDLLQYVRMPGESMTPAEAAQWEQGEREAFINEQFQEALEEGRVNQETVGEDAFEDKVQSVEDLLYEDLTNAGMFIPPVARYHATLMAKAFNADAARLGVDPFVLYQQSRLTFGRIDTKENAVPNAPTTETVIRPEPSPTPEPRNHVLESDAEIAQNEAAAQELDRYTKIVQSIRAAIKPDRSEKYPTIALLKKMGGVRIGSPLSQELIARDITAKRFPGLFKKEGGLSNFDNVLFSEHALFSENYLKPIDGYVDPEQLYDSLELDMKGDPHRTREQAKEDVERKAAENWAEHLNKLGIRYDEGSPAEVAAKMRESAIEQRRAGQTGALFQIAPEGRRGQFQQIFDESGDIVNLIEIVPSNMDLSTVLHEFGHFRMFKMIDYAFGAMGTEKGRASFRADLALIMNDLGVQFNGAAINLDQVTSADEVKAALTTEQHEEFAEKWEDYLMSGKAPSVELVPVFARFKAWLLSVYHSFRHKITPEMQGVFDRMVATQQEIIAHEQALSYQESDFITGLLSPEDAAKLASLSAMATDQAENSVFQDSMRELREQRTEQWNAESETLTTETREALMQDPVNIATEHLVFGRDKAGEKMPSSLKIKRQDIVALKGEDFLDFLPGRETNGKRKIIGPSPFAKNGQPAEFVAARFGFTSADEMLSRMAQTKAVDLLVQDSVHAEMLRRHGDVMNDGSLEVKANDAVHNDLRGEVLVRELNILRRPLGKAPITKLVALNMAKKTIGQMQYRDGTKPSRFVRQEQKAAKAFEEAAARQDVAGAARAKTQQLFAFFLVQESRRQAVKSDKAIRNIKKYTNKRVRAEMGKAGATYLEQIDNVLEKYEFKSVTLEELTNRKSLRDWYNEQVAKGVEPIVLEAFMDTDSRVNYKEIPIDLLHAINDTVSNIAYFARIENKLLAEKQERDLAEVTGPLMETLDENVKVRERELNPSRKSASRDAWQFVTGLGAKIVKASTYAAIMDGKSFGPWAKAIITPIRNAQAARHIRMNEEGAIFRALLEKYGDLQLSKKVFVAEIDQSLTREEILSIALNYGNDGNIDALLDDRGRGRVLTEADYMAIMRKLSPTDFKYVRDVWEYINHFWPEIAALEKRRTGLVPEKVEPRPFLVTANDGSIIPMPGGYYPLSYDSMLDQETGWFAKGRAAARQETLEGMGDLFLRGRFTRAQTRHGHTTERVSSAGRSPKWSLDVITQHVDQVVTDLTMWDAIRDVDMILRDRAIDDGIRSRMGSDVADALNLWLRDVAVGQSRSSDAFSRTLSGLRASMSVGAMGLKVATSLVQLTGTIQTAAVIGPRALFNGMAQYGAHPIETIRTVQDLSTFMRIRSETQQRDVRDALLEWEKSKVNRFIARSMFWPIVKMQQQVDMATWLGAYNKGLKESMSDQDAITYADTMVDTAQGSGLLSSLSPIERGTISENVRLSETVKLWTSFIFYFTTKLNVAIAKTRNAKLDQLKMDAESGMRVGRLAADYLALFWLETIMGDILLRAPGWLAGDDEDDDETTGWGIARYILLAGPRTAASGVPFLREVVSATQGYDAAPAPTRALGDLGSFIVSTSRTTGQLFSEDEDVEWYRFLRSFSSAANVLSPIKYPASQINVALRYIERASKGEDIPWTSIFLAPPDLHLGD